MKNNSGVSLIALIATIMIVIILASISIFSGMESVDEAYNTKSDVEMNGLKEAVAKKMIDNARNPASNPIVGRKIADATELLDYIYNMTDEQKTAFTTRYVNSNKDYYRIVDAAGATILGVDGFGEASYYLVDYNLGDVYGPVDYETYVFDN